MLSKEALLHRNRDGRGADRARIPRELERLERRLPRLGEGARRRQAQRRATERHGAGAQGCLAQPCATGEAWRRFIVGIHFVVPLVVRLFYSIQVSSPSCASTSRRNATSF